MLQECERPVRAGARGGSASPLAGPAGYVGSNSVSYYMLLFEEAFCKMLLRIPYVVRVPFVLMQSFNSVSQF